MRAILASVLSMWLGLAAAQSPAPHAKAPGHLRAEIVSFGEYASTPIQRVEDAPETASGLVIVPVANPSLLRRTTEVAAFDGVMFGLMVSVPGLAPDQTIPVTERTTTPGLRTPEGRLVHQGTHESELGAEPNFVGYCFDQGWDLVPGTWSITILHEGRALATQSFTVTVGARPDGREHCNPAPSVS